MQFVGYLPCYIVQADAWGLNVYRGATFGDVFTRWSGLSSLPMFIGEYGADAYNANIGAPDLDAQSFATVTLTQEILDNR